MTQKKAAEKTGGDAYMPDHRIETELSPRWVRVKLGKETIADSKQVLLLRETGHLPVYYFPQEDVRMGLLQPTKRQTHCPYKGDASYWSIKTDNGVVENAVWGYLAPLPERADIKGHVAFYWNKMDAWYEEEEEIFVHPRDPYKRIDVMPSSRHIRVVLGGEIVAESYRPYLLFETGLPTRYYLPQEDVRKDWLEPADSQSRCPYRNRD